MEATSHQLRRGLGHCDGDRRCHCERGGDNQRDDPCRLPSTGLTSVSALLVQALSPSMKSFHPLKLGGIWFIAVRLYCQPVL